MSKHHQEPVLHEFLRYYRSGTNIGNLLVFCRTVLDKKPIKGYEVLTDNCRRYLKGGGATTNFLPGRMIC